MCKFITVLWGMVVILSVLFIMGSPAFCDDAVVKARVVNAIIGEAEGEPYKGKVAIACAIINRTGTHGSFNKAMRGVYGEKASRVVNKKYSKKVKAEAERAYRESLDVGACNFIGGADHWEGTAFKAPKWSKGKTITATIGNQRFYK